MIVNRDQLSDVAARCFGVASLAQRLFLGLVFVGPPLLAIPLHLPAQAVGAGHGGTDGRGLFDGLVGALVSA